MMRESLPERTRDRATPRRRNGSSRLVNDLTDTVPDQTRSLDGASLCPWRPRVRFEVLEPCSSPAEIGNENARKRLVELTCFCNGPRGTAAPTALYFPLLHTRSRGERPSQKNLVRSESAVSAMAKSRAALEGLLGVLAVSGLLIFSAILLAYVLL